MDNSVLSIMKQTAFTFQLLPGGVFFTPHLDQSHSLLAGLQDAVTLITSGHPFHQ